MAERPPAPILRDAWLLAEWTLAHFEPQDRPLPRRICAHTLDLLEAVADALRSRDPLARLDNADAALGSLRLELRLSVSLGYLDDRQLLHILELTDKVGRQLGGWMRAAERVE